MSDQEIKEEQIEVKVVVADDARAGNYSNFVRIQHTAMDFRFDFAKAITDEHTLHIFSRIFMSPIHAKMFYKALEDNLHKYEEQFGQISLTVGAATPFTTPISHEKH